MTADTHRGTYSEPRGGQSNFTRPLPSRQPPTGRLIKYPKYSKNSTHFEIILLFKITVFYLNIFLNVIYFCDFKAEFLAYLFRSHDPSK